MAKSRSKRAKNDQFPPESWYDPNCRECPRLARFLDVTKTEFPDYFCAPVPSFGDPNARLLIVGLAPGKHGANASGRPFTGDHAGGLLYETLHRYGLSSASVSISNCDRLRLFDCRITNAVKCLPPENKPVAAEVNRCVRFLEPELVSGPWVSLPTTLLSGSLGWRLLGCSLAMGRGINYQAIELCSQATIAVATTPRQGA